MNSSDPPPMTSDSMPPRARSIWRTGCAVVVGGLAVTVALFFAAWWLVAPGGPLHALP